MACTFSIRCLVAMGRSNSRDGTLQQREGTIKLTRSPKGQSNNEKQTDNKKAEGNNTIKQTRATTHQQKLFYPPVNGRTTHPFRGDSHRLQGDSHIGQRKGRTHNKKAERQSHRLERTPSRNRVTDARKTVVVDYLDRRTFITLEMKSTKYNDRKFNQQYGYAFPIKQHRFDTTKHPIVLDKGRKAASITTSISADESKIVDGLSNILQVDKTTALRITLYEALSSPVEALEQHLPYADPQSKKKGHTGRNTTLKVSLLGKEKVAIQDMASELGISDKTFIRLAVIYLAKGIKNEHIKKLTKSRKLSQKECMDNHFAVKPNIKGSVSPLAPLRQAMKEGYEKARDEGQERDYEIYMARGEFMDWLTDQGREIPVDYFGEVDIQQVDQLMIFEEECQMEEFWNEHCEGESYEVKHTKLTAYFMGKGFEEEFAQDKAGFYLAWLEEQKLREAEFEEHREQIEKDTEDMFQSTKEAIEEGRKRPEIKVRLRRWKTQQERIDDMSLEERCKYAIEKKKAKEAHAKWQADYDERMAKHDAWMAEHYPNGVTWKDSGLEKGE